ncbi:MAG: plastocyanin, partial [Proteobacteria bacterium]
VVTMKSLSFDPKVVEVKKGESVEWTNKSYTDHSATSDESGKFDTGLVAPQKNSKAVVYSVPGTYLYHCSVHGKTMSGRVVVSP